ncbi:MAG TPA: DUF3293 domain-containing protein [Xanthomonadales bacterium]|nr:DUF3293 domain-containing protein [Xanthomonadales bacterium]
MTNLSQDQLAEYARAVYEVEVDGRWIEASTLPLIDASGTCALISACNPYSQLLPEFENSQRHQRLRDEIAASGYRCWPARGRSADSAWVEPGFLVLAPLAQIDAWARAFEQHAVWLASGSGHSPSLRVYSRFDGEHPPAQSGGMGITWVPAPN